MEHKNEKYELSTPNAIILAGIIIAGAIIFSNSYKFSGSEEKGNLGQNIANTATAEKVSPPVQGDHVKGDLTKAQVVLIEYSDLECPFCKLFQPTVAQVLS